MSQCYLATAVLKKTIKEKDKMFNHRIECWNLIMRTKKKDHHLNKRHGTFHKAKQTMLEQVPTTQAHIECLKA